MYANVHLQAWIQSIEHGMTARQHPPTKKHRVREEIMQGAHDTTRTSTMILSQRTRGSGVVRRYEESQGSRKKNRIFTKKESESDIVML